jgi:hypothetical protein
MPHQCPQEGTSLTETVQRDGVADDVEVVAADVLADVDVGAAVLGAVVAMLDGDEVTVDIGDCIGVGGVVDDVVEEVVRASTSSRAGAPLPDSRDRKATKLVVDGEVIARLTALPANAESGTLSATVCIVASVLTESMTVPTVGAVRGVSVPSVQVVSDTLCSRTRSARW